MKKLLILSFACINFLGAVAWAADETGHPCKNIKAGCESAGFYKGGNVKGKGLWDNCMKPILAGQSVTGVTVNAADVADCQKKMAEKEKK